MCYAIKSNPATRCLPVILLTTLNDPMDIIQGLESGADNFVTKPYSPSYLIERVATLLENKALRVGKSKVSVEIMFLGRRFAISSDKEQILDLLIATFEDMVRTNYSLQATQAELSEAKAKIEEYVQALEGRVRRSEEKYRTLMDQAPDAIMVFGTDGVLLESNQRVTDLFPGDALAGQHIGAITSANLAGRFATFVETETQGENEIEIRNPDGTVKQVEYALSFSDVGDERVVVAVMRDVTERRKLERDFHEAHKFAAVARLASGAAHDFNNVLMAIGTYAEFLIRQLPPGDPAHRAAEQVRHAAKRGSWLTGQLLAFTRGHASLNEIADVNSVIRGFADMLQQLAGKDVQFVFNLGEDAALVNLEAGRVEQIVMNLVVNARDAMDGRGAIAMSRPAL